MAPRSFLTYEKIAREVQKRPSLWDTMSFEYRDGDKKFSDWEEMAQLVYGKKDKLSVTLIKRKWKNMRDSYVRDYRAYLKQVKFGNKTIKKSKSFEIMKFINPHIKERQQKFLKFAREEIDNDDEDDEGVNAEDEGVNGEDEGVNAEDEDDQEEMSYDIKCFQENNAEIESEVIPEYHFMQPESPASMSVPVSMAIDNDETMSFFISLAKTVQRLKPYNQAVIKKTVANLILDAEIRESKEAKRDSNLII